MKSESGMTLKPPRPLNLCKSQKYPLAGYPILTPLVVNLQLKTLYIPF